MPNRAAKLFRLFKIICISEGSEPRRAISSAYSMSARERPGSILTPEVSESGREISNSMSITKLERKGERGQPCLTPLDVVNSSESFPYTRTRPQESAYSALIRDRNLEGTPLIARHCRSC
ncbi:hypothetical protein CLF_101077 [Clonorchis sinensis]|uniref:Uncharacterized protein n=1 Tax=Clonorchis sinensis TaxID=79923 RepID=G7Y4X8_CLOSI|nr:hypothetical protein CLF_101077 [Clonorchis sinensis]